MKAEKADDVLRDGALRMLRPFRQPAGNMKYIYNVRASPQEMPLQRPEPCEGKLSRTVLRGLGTGNSPRLPDPLIERRLK